MAAGSVDSVISGAVLIRQRFLCYDCRQVKCFLGTHLHLKKKVCWVAVHPGFLNSNFEMDFNLCTSMSQSFGHYSPDTSILAFSMCVHTLLQ